MKFVKGISFYVIVPLALLGTGFFAGVEAVRFFYPGNVGDKAQEEVQESIREPEPVKTQPRDFADKEVEVAQEVSADTQTLSVDTEYVVEETDIVNHSVVEIVGKLPRKYVGMNREQFLVAMESYQAYPPLSEQERGFVGLEVLSFSRERVVVQMNYEYLQPGEGFYLAVKDNEVVVYKEDQKTVYINTGILLESLPEEIQMEIIRMVWIEDEEALYAFLESYSS